MNESRKPTVFIGSSTEGLRFANAIQENFEHDDWDVEVWNQGAFELTRTFLESLTDTIVKHDFGIFIFTPDDLLRTRGHENFVARDNVIFEFGLFLGRRDRDRTFLLLPKPQKGKKPFGVPSDLAGISAGSIDVTWTDEKLRSKLGPVCQRIRTRISGSLKTHGLKPVDRLEHVVNVLEEAANGLATNSRGRFPSYYGDINKILHNAKRQICIATDFLTYGFFSAPEEFADYMATIDAQSENGVSCQLIVHNNAGRRQLLERQIGTSPKQWKALRNDPGFEGRLKAFCVQHRCKLESQSQLRTIVEKAHGETVRLLGRGRVREYASELPLLMWIVDEEVAVFAIPRFGFGKYASEHGFITRDASLVRTLCSIWGELWKKSK